MMKKLALIAGLLVSSFLVKAQRGGQDPVHWTYTAKKIADKTYELHITAAIDGGWHIYAQEQPKEAISQPTTITFTKNPLVTLTGKAKEMGDKKTQSIPDVGITQYMYEGKVDFVQVVKLKSAVNTSVAGTIEFQACTEEMCLQPKSVPFKIDVK